MLESHMKSTYVQRSASCKDADNLETTLHPLEQVRGVQVQYNTAASRANSSGLPHAPSVIHFIYGDDKNADHNNGTNTGKRVTYWVLELGYFLFLLLASLQHRYYYSHFTDEETGVQRGSHGSWILEPRGLEPRAMSKDELTSKIILSHDAPLSLLFIQQKLVKPLCVAQTSPLTKVKAESEACWGTRHDPNPNPKPHWGGKRYQVNQAGLHSQCQASSWVPQFPGKHLSRSKRKHSYSQTWWAPGSLSLWKRR